MGTVQYTKEPHSKVTIRFQDCDPFGHLNNAAYINYFINAREDHLQQFYSIDIYERQKDTKENWFITKNQIAYFQPCGIMEEVTIKTRLLRFTNNVILIEGLMLDAAGEKLKSVIWIEFRYVNVETGRLARHPDDLVSLLTAVQYTETEPIAEQFDDRLKQIKSRL